MAGLDGRQLMELLMQLKGGQAPQAGPSAVNPMLAGGGGAAVDQATPQEQPGMMERIQLWMAQRKAQEEAELAEHGREEARRNQEKYLQEQQQGTEQQMMEYIGRAMQESQGAGSQQPAGPSPVPGAGQSTIDTLRNRGLSLDEMIRQQGG